MLTLAVPVLWLLRRDDDMPPGWFIPTMLVDAVLIAAWLAF